MHINLEKIIALRKGKKLTITQTAKILDKARSTVSSWENGNTIPSKTDMVALAQLLGVKISEISDYKDIPEINTSQPVSSPNNTNNKSILKNLKTILNDPDRTPEEQIRYFKELLAENERLEAQNRSFKKSNKRYSTIINSIHEIIYIKDTERKFKKVNDTFIDELLPGYTHEDVIGSKFIDIMGRKEVGDIVLWENHVFQSGQSVIDEKIRIPGSAGKKFGLISIEPIFNENDKVIEIAVSIKDISEIVKNIENLELLESVSNKLDDQIWILTENPIQYKFIGGMGFEETYGISKEEFITNPKLWLEMIHPDDLSKAETTSKEGFFPLPLGENDLRIIRKDGTLRWIKYKASRTYDVNNKPILYGITTDITNRIKDQKSLDFLNKAISIGNDIIWVGYINNESNSFKYLYLTGNIERTLGIAEKQLRNNNQSWLENIFHLDIKKVKRHLSSKKYPISVEFRIQLPNKNLKWVHYKKCYKSGFYYGAFYDITEKKEIDLKREVLERAMCRAQDAVWIFDSNFKCIYITKATEKVYGISFKGIDDPIAYWTQAILHPDSRCEYEERLDNFKKQKKINPYFRPNPLIFKAVKPDGSLRYIESLFTCMKYNGKILDIAVDRDITELYEEVLKLNEIKKHLQHNSQIPSSIKQGITDLIKE